MSRRWLVLFVVVLVGLALIGLRRAGRQEDQPPSPDEGRESSLLVGFAEKDITPQLGRRPVYLAGFGHNRQATGVHDPLLARATVLQHEQTRLALVSVDLVGLFRSSVQRVRGKLPGYTHVLVCSTHNHEGPDSLGLWGPTPLKSGLDPAYLEQVEQGIVAAVEAAGSSLQPASARIGTASGPELLHDAREPYVKHDQLTALDIRSPSGEDRLGLVVGWNCHPETLGSENTLVSADFVGATVRFLKEKYRCPVLYLTGTVGGLMTSLHVPVRDEQGKLLSDGTFEKTELYGRLVGQLAVRALDWAEPLRLTPLAARVREIYLPLDNRDYRIGWQLGVLQREAFAWKDDPDHAKPVSSRLTLAPLCVQTEIGWLHLGQLDIAAIPGEIYPELVLGQVQDPPDPGADFPRAPQEPGIYALLPGPHRLLIGLASDEIGYIIPQRQWDEKPPYCYGRKKPQYGEGNSLGPRTAPLLCRAFAELVGRHK
jgi:hypothetical protein